MYCLKCGKRILDDSDFCVYCGQKLSGDFHNSDLYSTGEQQPSQENFKTIVQESAYVQDERTKLTKYPWNGRLSREKYLILFLVVGLPSLVLIGWPEKIGLNLIGVVLNIVWYIAAIKRCHDCDQSGWYCLLLLIPLVGLMFGIYLLFRKGTPWANKYGEVQQR